MSRCDSCIHKEVCSYKNAFQEFEKEKTSGKYPKPESAFDFTGEFNYEAMKQGTTVVFSVEVKCNQYSSVNNQFYRSLQQIYGNQQTGPFYK